MNKPKYQIGQKVWRIYASKCEEIEITGIHRFELRDSWNIKKIEFRYSKEDSAEKWSWIREDDLFPTKEDLIKSL